MTLPLFGKSGGQWVSIDPKTHGGERAEVACRFQGSGRDGAVPGGSEIRHAMDRHSIKQGDHSA